ncbi:MAG TPA: trypsin-like peptidase domain-containing protein [Solirubrobacteraceae bacterium]
MIFPDDNPTPTQPITPEPPPPVPNGSSRNPARSLLAAAVLVVALAAFGGAALSHVLWPSNASNSAQSGGGNSVFGGGFQQLPQNQGGGSSGSGSSGSNPAASAAAASVARKIDPGLVDVNTETQGGPAAGTGMVVTSDGEVLTNNHVIKGAESVTATDLGNGRTYTARVIGYDRNHDVAVIQLEGASGLATVPFGESSSVRTGSNILTFGNAGGVGGTPSVAGGSVVGLGRSITASDPSTPGDSERLTGLIEIDGEIQPGDSGGPLTTGGKVVGMDTAASVGFNFQSASGAGYAIPIDNALAIARDIVAGQSTSTIHIGETAIIGVYVAANSAGNLAYSNCPASESSQSGVLIADPPINGSPAVSSGIERCDLITAIDGKSVGSPAALLNLMETHHPGDSVSMGWLDTSGQSHSVTIRLGTGTPD